MSDSGASHLSGGDPPRATEAVRAALEALTPVVDRLERQDLLVRVRSALERIQRPDALVCVVGEFKQGKSSLINALVGQQVCPVDDDLATAAITVVQYREIPEATVHRWTDTELISERVAIEDLAAWVTEAENPDNEKRIERVDVGVPCAILRDGMTLVDTPGMGGLTAGYAAATLAFLPLADGLVFVSDASAELSEPEVEFLVEARQACPDVPVLFTQSKIDLYGQWRDMLTVDRGHLLAAGVTPSMPMFGVSSVLHDQAKQRSDQRLDDRSGFPELIEALANIVASAREQAASRAASDARAVAAMARSGLETERSVLTDPSHLEAVVDGLDEAERRLQHLRESDSRWQGVIERGMSALEQRIVHDFRSDLRAIARAIDEKLEQLENPAQWDDLSKALQLKVSTRTKGAFDAIERGVREIESDVHDILADEQVRLQAVLPPPFEIDIDDFWPQATVATKQPPHDVITSFGRIGSGISAIGALGALCQLLPAAAAVMVVANPLLLGLGVILGGVTVADERRRKVAARRQAARDQIRTFLDDVDFEVSDRVADMVRRATPALAHQVAQQLRELEQTYADTARRAREGQASASADRPRRLAELDDLLDAISKVESLCEQVAS